MVNSLYILLVAGMSWCLMVKYTTIEELASQFLGSSPIYTSDSHVLLDLWALIGVKALPLLKGFFSVCIFDNNTSQLYAFRDAFGIKPLWLNKNENFLHLCSEINPFLTNSNHRSQLISPHGLACYLTFGYSFSSFPILQNIIPLQPGHLYCFTRG